MTSKTKTTAKAIPRISSYRARAQEHRSFRDRSANQDM